MFKNSFLTQETGPFGFQWWYFDAEFSNGYSTTLVMLPYSVGVISGLDMEAQDPSVLIAITTPEGKTYSARQSYSFSDLTASIYCLNARLGNNNIKFDGNSYILTFSEGELKASLVIEPTLPSWSPLGDGDKTRLDGSVMEIFGLNPDYFFDYVECMPRGEAKGFLEIGDEKIKVNGIGYHEQGFGNFHLGEMIESWFWTKYYFKEYTLIIAGIRNEELLDGFKISGIMIAREDKIVVSYMDMGTQVSIVPEEYKILEETGELYPSVLSVNIDLDDLKINGRIKYLFLRDSWGYNYPEGACKPLHKPSWLQYTSEIDFEMVINGKIETINTRGVYESMISG